jgi:predicted metal-binding membrane protein
MSAPALDAPGTLERLLRRDRALIIAALAALTALSWLQMWAPGACPVSAGAPPLSPCCASRFAVAFPMWVVMMAGMMIPSAAPMVLTHAAIARRRAHLGAPFVSSALFLAGYLCAWPPPPARRSPSIEPPSSTPAPCPSARGPAPPS